MGVNVSSNGRNNPASYVDRRALAGSAALITGGLVLCLAGATAGTVALVAGIRRYVADLEEPPTEMARRRWGQVRSATAAGAGAWQDFAKQSRAGSGA